MEGWAVIEATGLHTRGEDADWCGGRVFIRVLFTPEGTNLELPGSIEVFCIIGPNPPNNHGNPSGEGVVVNVPGSIHFNRIVFGDNLYIQTS